MNLQTFKKGENKQLTKNFNSREFECSCTCCESVTIDLDHVNRLQKLRDDLGVAITINSGHRCAEHNATVGGVDDSQHVVGTATDIVAQDMSPNEVADACEGFNGLGRYDTFTHVDSRESDHKARWDERKKQEYLPSGPTDEDINVDLDAIEDAILN